MQKLFFTMLTLACAIALVYFTFNFNSAGTNTQATVAVAKAAPVEILFEHNLNNETFLLYRTKDGDDLSVAILTRNLLGISLQDSATQYDVSDLARVAGMNYVIMPKSESSPYTVFAGWTDDPQLYEVFVTEPGFPIAHAIRVFESDIPGLYAWMAISPDFTGTNYAITAVNEASMVVGGVENDGAQRVFHLIND
ncbi:MAG: hypothetical protein FWF59_15390 [Turicibacter sp.]|nr:hypothetical protein [Turicibacter sp.]